MPDTTSVISLRLGALQTVDVDLLVVKSGVPHRRRLAQQIHQAFFGLGVPIDVIVVTPEDIGAFQHKVGTIIEPALRQGREIYAA